MTIAAQFDAARFPATLSDARLCSAPSRPPEREDQPVADVIQGESFGSRLQRLRKSRRLTLAQVAAQLGVSKPTVWAWEQGKARPVEGRIEALAQVYGVDASDLVPGRITSALVELIARSKEQIAEALGTSPDKIRIMFDL